MSEKTRYFIAGMGTMGWVMIILKLIMEATK